MIIPCEHPRAEPMCYGNSCTCPKGYKFNLSTKICDFDHIPIPAEGKNFHMENLKIISQWEEEG